MAISPNARDDFKEVVEYLTTYINQWAHEKGFYEDGKSNPKAIALMHSELSEALEALRDGNPESEKIEGYSQFTEELADLVIRVFDTAGQLGIPLGDAIIAKMDYNEDREYKHGKEF